METFELTYSQRRALLKALKAEARFVDTVTKDIVILTDAGDAVLRFKVNEIAGPAKDPDLQTPSEREVVNGK